MIVFYECECGGHGIRYTREYTCGETLSDTRFSSFRPRIAMRRVASRAPIVEMHQPTSDEPFGSCIAIASVAGRDPISRINQPMSIALWSATDRANCRCQPDATSLAIHVWLTFLWYASTASCNISCPTSLSAAAFCSHCVATPAPKPTPAGSPATRKSTSSLWACPILYRAATTPYPCPAAR